MAVLATGVPKAVALRFLETISAPGDTFTSLVYGDLWDMVVYRDPLSAHEFASSIGVRLLTGIGRIFGGHKRFAARADPCLWSSRSLYMSMPAAMLIVCGT